MINLLPENQIQVVRKLYHRRLAVIVVIFLFCLVIAADALLLPSFFLANAKEHIAQNRLADITVRGTRADRDSLDTIIKDINQKLMLLSTLKNTFRFSETGIDAIITKRGTGVLLERFNAVRQTTGAYQMTVSGTAKSRESLQSFVRALAADSRYQGVALPVSNLARGSDIVFTLSFVAVNQ